MRVFRPFKVLKFESIFLKHTYLKKVIASKNYVIVSTGNGLTYPAVIAGFN